MASDPTAAEPVRAAGWTGDAVRVGLLVAVSLLVHGWLVRTTSTTARDSIGFAQLALQYESPAEAVATPPLASRLDVMRHGLPPHPPGYPVAVLLTSKVVRAVTPGPLTDQMLLSTQIASVVAGVLLVLPSYALGCLLFNRFTGFAAGLLLQLLPVLARVTSDGLTEAWYLLFFTSAAAAGTWAMRKPSAGGFFLTGALSGLAYLVRPEGSIVAAAAAAAAVWVGLGRRAAVRITLLYILALLAGAGLFAGPYMLAIGGVTLKPALSGEERAAVVAGPLVARTHNPDIDGGRLAWVPGAVFQEAFKAFHYGVFFYAVAGLGLALWAVRDRPWLYATLFLGAGNLALLGLVAYRAGYISERHTLPVVLVAVFYAAHAMDALPGLFARLPVVGPVFAVEWVWRWMALSACVVSCLPVVVKPLHENRAGHRVIGGYLKQNASREQDVVIDPYTWAQYYSERSLRGVPPDPPNPRYRWAILEEGEGEQNSHLTRWEPAAKVRDDKDNPPVVAEVWYDPARPGRRITLYRQDARK